MVPSLRLRGRFRPWYLLDVAAFLFGAGGSLERTLAGELTRSPAAIGAITPFDVVVAVASGLLAVVVLRFTLGNVWAYAVEYANAGGRWSDLAFLLPVCGGVVALAVTYATTSNLWAAAWAGFWIFAGLAAVVAVAASVAAGYADVSA
jgi:hypothetical protein